MVTYPLLQHAIEEHTSTPGSLHELPLPPTPPKKAVNSRCRWHENIELHHRFATPRGPSISLPRCVLVLHCLADDCDPLIIARRYACACAHADGAPCVAVCLCYRGPRDCEL
jgi:hypothetical protein